MAYPKMNPKIKKRWVKALRSAKYEQARESLRERVGGTGEEERLAYCCLGVLCDVIDPTLWKGDNSYNDCWSFPPADIAEKAGLPARMDHAGEYPDSHPFNTLARLNDDGYASKSKGSRPHREGANFAKIADWIEKYL